MRVCRFLPGLLGLAIGLFCSTPPASAIVLETDDGKKIVGYVVGDDGKRITILTPGLDGKPFPKPVNRERIRKIYSELDETLLEGLSSRNPKGYWDYAEVQAEQWRKHADPEAKETAMRLYLIAATLNKETYGSKALLKLSALTDKPADARRCRAMAFLLDPKADAAEFLKKEVAKPAPPDKSPALQDFIKALQLYRAGQMDVAIETAKHDGVDRIFSASGVIELKVFLQWCADAAEPRPDDALRLVLRAELWAMNPRRAADDAGQKDATDPNSWSAILQSHGDGAVSPLSLDTFKVGDVNPRKCRRQDRKWVEE